MDEIKIKRQESPRKVEYISERKERKSPRKLIIIFLALLVVGGGFYFIYNYFSGEKEIDAVGAVSKLYMLPENDTPTIATVKDAAKLRSKVFFINAQEGDKVLIYKKADLVILYRPSDDKIINVDRLSNSKIEI